MYHWSGRYKVKSQNDWHWSFVIRLLPIPFINQTPNIKGHKRDIKFIEIDKHTTRGAVLIHTHRSFRWRYYMIAILDSIGLKLKHLVEIKRFKKKNTWLKNKGYKNFEN